MPQPYWAYPVPSWGYVGPILQQLAHPLLGLHVAIFHCIKLNLTWRIFWLKMRLSSNMQIYQWHICLDGQTNKGWTHKTAYIYIFICKYIRLSTYLSIGLYIYIYIYKCAATIAMDSFFWVPNQHRIENTHTHIMIFQVVSTKYFDLKTFKTQHPGW